MQLTNARRKAKMLSLDDQKEDKVEKTKNSKNSKNELMNEIQNFKEVISNQVLVEISQLKNFSNLTPLEKREIKTKLEFVMNSNFNNLLERVSKKF